MDGLGWFACTPAVYQREGKSSLEEHNIIQSVFTPSHMMSRIQSKSTRSTKKLLNQEKKQTIEKDPQNSDTKIIRHGV